MKDKTITITLKVNETTKEYLDMRSNSLEMNTSEYIRQLILRDKVAFNIAKDIVKTATNKVEED